MKRVLVTGSAGFIGSHVATAFAERGWRVFGLVHRMRPPEPAAGTATSGTVADSSSVTYVHGDVTDAESLRDVLRRCGGRVDAIVHCAGRASDVGWRREFRRTNYESVCDLARLVTEFDVGRLVFVSTTDVYGLHDFHGQQEDETPLDLRARHPYPRFKILAEELIRASLPPERYVLLRPAQVWGPGDRTITPRVVAFLRASPAIVHFGRWRGRNRCPLAHVRNVAVAAVLAADRPEVAGQAVNVIDAERTTVDEFYRRIAVAFLPGKPFRTVLLPYWGGWLAAAPVSALSTLLNLRQPFSDPSLYALRTVSHHLDFGNDRLQALFALGGERFVTRDEGFAALGC